jgi:CubicO group peptidase (beta-lactamase class C family)
MTDQTIHRAKIEQGGRPILDDSPTLLFPWWSFTKTAISACALQLVARGRLDLNETLPGRPYNLRQLLQHRAGVPEYGKLASYHEAVKQGDAPWTADELIDRVDPTKLDFQPDEGWGYSNVGYLFVRQIIEKTVDDDIGVAIQTLVFDPLDIRAVRLVTEPGDLNDTAWGNKDGYHPGWVYHGLLVGTALESVRFLDGLMSGRLLPPPLLEIMKTRHPVDGTWSGRPWEQAGYGLGMMNGTMSKVGRVFGHSGVGPDTVSAVYHFPECQPPCTVAAFSEGNDQGANEWAAVNLAAQI